MRYAVERERGGGENNIERRIAARPRPEGSGLHRQYEVLNTLVVFCDALAKAVLTALPEPQSSSIARSRERYERFLWAASARSRKSGWILLYCGTRRCRILVGLCRPRISLSARLAAPDARWPQLHGPDWTGGMAVFAECRGSVLQVLQVPPCTISLNWRHLALSDWLLLRYPHRPVL